MDLIWIARYSDSDLPDKHGRWSRLCFYNGLLISCISRINNGNRIMYTVRDFFPSTGNDMPEYSGLENDFEIAKKGVEKRFNNLIKKLNLSNTFSDLPYTKEEWNEAIRIKNEHLKFMKEIRDI